MGCFTIILMVLLIALFGWIGVLVDIVILIIYLLTRKGND